MGETGKYTMNLEIENTRHSDELARYESYIRASLSNAAKDLVRKARTAYRHEQMTDSIDGLTEDGREDVMQAIVDSVTQRNSYDELTDWVFGDEPFTLHIEDENIARVLRKLPEKWLNIMIMNEIHGIPMKEIALKYNTTEASVKMMKSKGYKRVRELLSR